MILSTGGGACVAWGMRDRGWHAWWGACVAGGHAWWEVWGVRDWNAFLLQGVHAVKKSVNFNKPQYPIMSS